MSDDKVLTKEIADQFLLGEASVDTQEFTAVAEDAAEILKYYGRGSFCEACFESRGDLYLDGLKSLSDAAAESLSQHTGVINLDGLTCLSDAAVESLSKHEGDLYLQGLTSLSDAAAESLSNYEGDTLWLDGLTSLSDAAVESLSKHTGDTLYLNGLTSLSDAAAESLSKHEMLYLDGLTSLSDAAAESLSKPPRGELTLRSLTSLSDAAAESLRKYGGALYLNNLTAESRQIPDNINFEIKCVCEYCEQTESIFVREADYLAWEGAASGCDPLIQDVMWYLTAPQREMMLRKICEVCCNRRHPR